MGRVSVHISSAVVSVLPAHRENVIRLLSNMPGVEVHHQSPSKIVIVLEGPDSGVPVSYTHLTLPTIYSV